MATKLEYFTIAANTEPFENRTCISWKSKCINTDRNVIIGQSFYYVGYCTNSIHCIPFAYIYRFSLP